MEYEIWKPIIGHERDYEVSSHGRVRRISYCCASPEGRILSQYSGHGYLNHTLCTDGKMTRYRSHVLVARAFVPNPDGKPQVNHKDCDKANNYYGNLEWVTGKENRQHAMNNGRYVAFNGVDNPNSKLTTEQVLQMRAERNAGASIKHLSIKYDIHYQAAYRIIHRLRWAHI
jgi:hypothetical protein